MTSMPGRKSHEEIDQPLGVPLPRPDVAARLPEAGQGCRVRRDRAQLRPGERPLAEGRPRRVPRDPQDRRGDRHRHQRALFVSLLAVLAHRQRPGATGARSRAGPAHDRGRPRAGNGKPADDCRIDLYPLAPRAGAGRLRRLRPPGPRGDRRAVARGGKIGRVAEHREHLLQRLPDARPTR